MKISIADLLAGLGWKAGGDRFCLHGRMEAQLTKPDGSIIVRAKDNLIVDVGFSFIAQSIGLASGRPNVMSYIAVGTGTTAAATGNPKAIRSASPLGPDRLQRGLAQAQHFVGRRAHPHCRAPWIADFYAVDGN